MSRDIHNKGTYRAIYSVLLDDPDFRKLPPNARFVFLALKISRLNNQANIFLFDEGGPMTLSKQTGLPLSAVNRALKTLAEKGWIHYENPILWIRNGLRYDPLHVPNNPNHVKGLQKVISGLPKSDIVRKFCLYYGLEVPSGYGSDTPGDTLRIPSESPSNTLPDHDSDSDSDKDKDSEGVAAPTPIPFREILDDLNTKAGTTYRHTSQATQRLIRARWNEGFTLDDFKIVHDTKVGEWLRESKMRKYLRPETLYGTKFESYRNQLKGTNNGSKHNDRIEEKYGRYSKRTDMPDVPKAQAEG